MTAHAYATERRAQERDGQPRLFAIPGGAEAAPVPPLTAAGRAAAAQARFAPAPERQVALAAAPVPVAPARSATPPATAPAPATTPSPAQRTLDAELRLAWTALTAGAPAACILCGGRMEPHAHAPGGACTDCGTTLE